MGETVAEVKLIGPQDTRSLRAVVDTGATNTVIDESLAKELGIRATRFDEVMLANEPIEKVWCRKRGIGD